MAKLIPGVMFVELQGNNHVDTSKNLAIDGPG
jgi:hypothetical protein